MRAPTAAAAGEPPEPYCCVLVDGIERARTRFVHRTTSPTWNARLDMTLRRAGRIDILVHDYASRRGVAHTAAADASVCGRYVAGRVRCGADGRQLTIGAIATAAAA